MMSNHNSSQDKHDYKVARAVMEELIAQDEEDNRTLRGWLREEIDKETKQQLTKQQSLESLSPVERIFADSDPEAEFSTERRSLLDTIKETENRISLRKQELEQLDLKYRPAPRAKEKTTCLL